MIISQIWYEMGLCWDNGYLSSRIMGTSHPNFLFWTGETVAYRDFPIFFQNAADMKHNVVWWTTGNPNHRRSFPQLWITPKKMMIKKLRVNPPLSNPQMSSSSWNIYPRKNPRDWIYNPITFFGPTIAPNRSPCKTRNMDTTNLLRSPPKTPY